MFDAILSQPDARLDSLRRIATSDFVGKSLAITEMADRLGAALFLAPTDLPSSTR